jgi:hypothetical protein
MTVRTVVGLVVVLAVGSVANASTGWVCGNGMMTTYAPPPATEAVVATLRDRAACAGGGSRACALLAAAEPSAPPAGTIAGVRFACVSDVVDGMPSDLVAALAGRLTSGEAVWWDGEVLRVAHDPGAVAAAAACLEGSSCADLRLPMLAGAELGPAEWSKEGGVWVVVEPGEDGCTAVSFLPGEPPGGPRAVATATLGSRLP